MPNLNDLSSSSSSSSFRTIMIFPSYFMAGDLNMTITFVLRNKYDYLLKIF